MLSRQRSVIPSDRSHSSAFSLFALYGTDSTVIERVAVSGSFTKLIGTQTLYSPGLRRMYWSALICGSCATILAISAALPESGTDVVVTTTSPHSSLPSSFLLQAAAKTNKERKTSANKALI